MRQLLHIDPARRTIAADACHRSILVRRRLCGCSQGEAVARATPSAAARRWLLQACAGWAGGDGGDSGGCGGSAAVERRWSAAGPPSTPSMAPQRQDHRRDGRVAPMARRWAQRRARAACGAPRRVSRRADGRCGRGVAVVARLRGWRARRRGGQRGGPAQATRFVEGAAWRRAVGGRRAARCGRSGRRRVGPGQFMHVAPLHVQIACYL